MANGYMKISSTSLTIKEMQIKSTLRYHLIPVRMVIIKKTRGKNIGEDMEKREHSCTIGVNANCFSYYGKQSGDSSNG